MTFFDETKSIVENINFLSGFLIFIVALIGLYQLKIAKDSIKINSEREAAKLAFELCEKYIPILKKLRNELVTKMYDLDIDAEKIEKLDLHALDEIKDNNENISEFKKLLEKYDEIEDELFNLVDKLEEFSISFTRKLADEQFAYSSEFLNFYQFCNLCSVEVIKTRKERPNDKAIFEHVIELYSIWKERNEKEKIEHQVKNLLAKSSKLNDRKIKPIGT